MVFDDALPSILESGLHKLRRKTAPPLPQDQKFVVSASYRETYSKENFLIYDKRKSAYGGRLMIFASDQQLNVLYNSSVLFADGTFKVTPTLFEQLYVLHGMQDGEGMSSIHQSCVRCMTEKGKKCERA